VDSKFGSFPDIKENGQVRTEDGRAEVLLRPASFSGSEKTAPSEWSRTV